MNIFNKIIKKMIGLAKRIINKIYKLWLKYKNQGILEKFVQQINEENKPTIVFLNVVDWNIPLFQRPQHIAKNLANKGYNYIFLTGNIYDDIVVYKQEIDNLYIVNACYFKDIIKSINVNQKYIHLYSTDMKTTNKDVDKYINDGYEILYEYIDEISEDLYGSKIPKEALEKHIRMINDRKVYFVCTARKLYNEVAKIRGEEKLRLITNGVEYEHFIKSNQLKIKETKINNQKEVIGYFGAFAKWFDYELVEKLAKERPNYEIMLIGWDYDGSINKTNLLKYHNIHVLGPIHYNDLPAYAQKFSVSMIPFLINDITESTSPIKLFEYMALGKAIVTTNMPECRLYNSVLIGYTHEEFIDNIDKAIKLNLDQAYRETLKLEALENTWSKKAEDIIKLLGEKI